METKYPNFKLLWFDSMISKLRKVLPPEEVSNQEIKTYLIEQYDKKYNPEGRFYSNITNDNQKMKFEDFINKYISSDYILTGYCCLFDNQVKGWPISIEALQDTLKQRKINKKAMLNYKVGTDEFKFYNNNQLNYKIQANSYYGILSLQSSLLYNPYVQNSVTLTAQDIITTSISAMESFMTNSNKFDNIDEFLDFVSNCTSNAEKYNIDEYVDGSISADKLFEYLAGRFTKSVDRSIIRIVVDRLSEHDRNIVYYKNNLLELLSNSYFIKEIIELTKEPYILDPSTDDERAKFEQNKEHYKQFRELVCSLVFYNHILPDRYSRATTNVRDTIKVVDTDSNFIYADNQIEYLAKLIGKSDDEEIKFNILNLIIDLCQEVEKMVYETLTTNFNIPKDFRPIINMKNEFVYKTLLITKNKKSYAGWLKSKLGKMIAGDSVDTHLDMKGISIKKTTVTKTVRDSLQNLLVENILKKENISLPEIMNEYDRITEIAENELKSGNPEYCIPKQINMFDNYDDPYKQDVVRGVTVRNLFEPDLKIIPPEKVYLLKLKVKTNFNDPDFQAWKEKYPDKFKLIYKTVFDVNEGDETFRMKKFGFDIVAIPYDTEKIPEYLLPLIDIDEMINMQLRNANIILEALGIYCNSKDDTASNIIEI